VGAIDGTLVRASIPTEMQIRFCGRKDGMVQNVLAAITFDIKFSYVLASWEGSAHDSRVLNDALNRPRGLQIPEGILGIESDFLFIMDSNVQSNFLFFIFPFFIVGRYYLGDAGYEVRKGVICPYRFVRYHLNEFSDNPLRNSKELFNLRHSSLRITIERCFGVLKKCFRVLDAEPFWSFPTQVDIVLACCIIHNHIIGVDPLDSIVNDVALDTQFENGSTSRRVQQSQREIQGENREWV
jgi:hypothetical protein